MSEEESQDEINCDILAHIVNLRKDVNDLNKVTHDMSEIMVKFQTDLSELKEDSADLRKRIYSRMNRFD